MMGNMKGKATLIADRKRKLPDGSVIQRVIWQVPTPVTPCTHHFKYRLVYIRNGVRVVGFDNERGKGDHMHLDGQEQPYTFTNIRQLVADFYREIKKRGVT